MSNPVVSKLHKAPVVPLIQANDPQVAVSTAKALAAGGLEVVEVVLRTPEALKCMERVASEVPTAVVGAGTVLSEKHARSAIDAGAQFLVSPGLDARVVHVSDSAELPVFPGIATPSELQEAHNLGLRIVKFFPATLNGGTAMLNALGSVFRDVQFVPTGGIDASNLAEFIALPSVLACGGSWLTPKTAIQTNDFDRIEKMARESIEISRHARALAT